MMSEKQPICGETSTNDEAAAAASEGINYINCLPRELLHRILSFLPFEYYIILCMASRPWGKLLVEAGVLHFDEKKFVSKMSRKLFRKLHKLHPHVNEQLCTRSFQKKSRRRFSAFVNRAISHYSNSSVQIKYMHLSFQYEPKSQNVIFINDWICFMMTRDIEKLELSFSQTPKEFPTIQDFEFPCQQPFHPKCTSFTLKFCQLKTSKFGSFANLKVFHLSDVRLLDKSIGQFLAKCQILEDFKMERCSVSENFFDCKEHLNLKKLKLINCMTHKKEVYNMDISVPQLIILELKGNHIMDTTIRNATNLIHCSIEMHVNFPDTSQGNLIPWFLRYISPSQGNYLAFLMTCLQSCHTLTLDNWCIKAIRMLDDAVNLQLQDSFTNLRQVTFKSGCLKRELSGVVVLLKMFPVLETLILEIHNQEEETEEFIIEEDVYLNNPPGVIPGLENKVKDLHVYWLIGQDHEMKMIGFLLQKALVLENLVICNDWSIGNGLEEPLERVVMEKVLNLPRGSSNVDVSSRNVKFPC